MNFLNNIKIGTRLNIVLNSVFFIILILLGIYILYQVEKRIISNLDERLYEQVEDINKFINIQLDNNQSKVNWLGGIKKVFKSKTYLESGYPFIVDENGVFIMHPNYEGKNYSDAEFFRKLKSTNGKKSKTSYEWEGRKKHQYSVFNEKLKAYVCVSIYQDEALEVSHNMRIAFIVAIIVGLILFGFTNTLISRSISASLSRGIAFAKRVAAGDLTSTIDIKQKDEIGQLAKAFNDMIIKLREIVNTINKAASGIVLASSEISSGSEQLSQGANEQASSTEEVTSSMEEMVANLQQSVENAKIAEDISKNMSSSMEKMGASGKNNLQSINSIAAKILVINEIAFKTNILALNAAVEAARAGDHGKGFAVVASEVRKLAEHSKNAADEIIRQSEDSVRVSQESSFLIESLTPEIVKMAQFIQEIAGASNEQIVGANTVNTAMQELNNVTQNTASASEQLSSNASELLNMANRLKNAIAYFKISD